MSLTCGTALGGRCEIYVDSSVQYLVRVKRRRTPIVITGVKKSRTKSLTAADKLSAS
jgi:hypothetical protein